MKPGEQLEDFKRRDVELGGGHEVQRGALDEQELDVLDALENGAPFVTTVILTFCFETQNSTHENGRRVLGPRLELAEEDVCRPAHDVAAVVLGHNRIAARR